MDNSFCLICGFFPTYSHKSSLPFIMKRHCATEGHKKRLLVNQERDYPILKMLEIENNKLQTKKKQTKPEFNGFDRTYKNIEIHFKV